MRPWLRALRVHQWSKNLLLLLPLLAAHLSWTSGLLWRVTVGFCSFSALASAVYLLNDLVDRPHDREHPDKRARPVVSGRISASRAVLTALALLAASILLATTLPPAFGVTLAAYALLNAAYMLRLKRVAVMDVVILSALYTARLVAGAAIAEIPLTAWFLAFSVFLFLSLALLKRVVELRGVVARGSEPVLGRGYRSSDVPILTAVGPSTGLLSALVYCLYITGPVEALYDEPEILWAGLPLLLYWIIRIWLLAIRGEVDEDPVAFALRDPASYLIGGAFLLTVYVAA